MARRPRRNHGPAFKAEVAVAAIKGEKTLVELAQSFDAPPNQIKQRRDQLLEGTTGVRELLKDKRMRACIPGRRSRRKPAGYDKHRYRRRNRIEIAFGRLKDWKRVSTRYDRCRIAFLPAVVLAAAVSFWL